MSIRQRLTRKQVTDSTLNSVKLDMIERSYSDKNSRRSHNVLSPRYISVFAGLSTILVFILTFGTTYGIYGLIFGSEDRLAIVGADKPLLDSFGKSESPSSTDGSTATNPGTQTSSSAGTGAQSQNSGSDSGNLDSTVDVGQPSDVRYCSVGSSVPEEVCRAILSIQDDKTISNEYLSASVVKLIEILPASSTIKILEDTWEPSPEGGGIIDAEVYAGSLGDFLVSGTIIVSGDSYLITEIGILSIL